ncbi:ABC transporter substrate-binding protein [Segniliparus rugosus]|uniref:Taurine ABC transporter, periplasmic binding protein n=1 Tax=Segniliparus rugosus (strain ATCC BAA-974 / DSM 45345 / CCUG 50838 / CIP 108380 / JCM 13579 / CDC 945) TaxID=679197 RepID=U1M249_SEGRC|nr:ABC transporter substrate-binding protein [Segniliparus rugosus]ERG69155.1 taurine ABC transporter, periplasmic binding protein [Segniliparus rugosus ATCC BAA-974]
MARQSVIRAGLARALALVLPAALAAACAIHAPGQSSGKPTIRIAYQTFPSGDLIVRHQRWLEEALPAYNIKWTKFDSGADVNTAFLAGEVDFGSIGSSPVARGLSAPLNIPYQVAFVLDVAGDNEALVARDGSGVNSVADLRGKRVGTAFASTAHYSLLAALAKAGVAPDEVRLIDVQPQASLAAWQRGDLDAVYTWLPTLDELRKSGKTLLTSRALAESGKPTLDLGVVSRAFAAQHPEVVDLWRKAEARALQTIAEDPKAAAKAVAAEIGIDPAAAADQLRQGIFLSPADEASAQWLGSAGAPGGVAGNLLDAARFLLAQKQIPAAPDEASLREAVYTKGLPAVLAS